MNIVAHDVSVDLAGRRVLERASARLVSGELIGVVGPNGAGKSTFARALLGLVRPTQGTIELDGENISKLRPATIATRMAYLPQGAALHWPLSVERLVSLGRLPHLGPFSRITAADREAIHVAMADTDTSRLAARTASELSGGERARVMLARALATGAPAIIADEPLASLDPGHQLDMMSLLERRAARGALVVVLLHDLTMATRFCRRLLLIDRGHIVADGTRAEVLTDERLRTVYGITAWRGEMDGDDILVPHARTIDAVSDSAVSDDSRQVSPNRG